MTFNKKQSNRNMNTEIEYMEVGVIYSQLAAIAAFASTDKTRQHLCTVCLEFAGNHARLIATDGRRLALLKIPIDDYQEEGSVMIPTKLIKAAKIFSKAELLQLVIEKTDGGNDLFKGTRLTFREGRDSVTGWAIDGTFPDWKQVLPSSGSVPNARACFNLGLASDCSSAIAMLTGDKSQAVEMHWHSFSDTEKDSGCYSLIVPTRDDFYAVFMPSASDGDYVRPHWLPKGGNLGRKAEKVSA